MKIGDKEIIEGMQRLGKLGDITDFLGEWKDTANWDQGFYVSRVEGIQSHEWLEIEFVDILTGDEYTVHSANPGERSVYKMEGQKEIRYAIYKKGHTVQGHLKRTEKVTELRARFIVPKSFYKENCDEIERAIREAKNAYVEWKLSEVVEKIDEYKEALTTLREQEASLQEARKKINEASEVRDGKMS